MLITATCHTRRHHPVGAASRYTTAMTGRIKSACIILVMKPKPTSAPARTSHLVCARSRPRMVAYSAPASSIASMASGLL